MFASLLSSLRNLPTVTSDTQANHDLQRIAGRHIISIPPYQRPFTPESPMNLRASCLQMETSGRLTRALNAFAALNYELHASRNRSLCPDTPLPAGAVAGRLLSASTSAAPSVSLTVLRLPKSGAAAGLPMRSKLLFPQRVQASHCVQLQASPGTATPARR